MGIEFLPTSTIGVLTNLWRAISTRRVACLRSPYCRFSLRDRWTPLSQALMPSAAGNSPEWCRRHNSAPDAHSGARSCGCRNGRAGGHIGTARMAKIEAWVCRKTWKPTAGAMPARAQASRIGRSCSALFQARPSSQRSKKSPGERPTVKRSTSSGASPVKVTWRAWPLLARGWSSFRRQDCNRRP